MKRVVAFAGVVLCLAVGVTGCGQDEVATTGTNSLTVEVVDLVGATGSELRGELSMNVDYGQTAPTWTMLTTPVTASPFTHSDTLGQLPEGEFGLFVTAGSAGTTETAKTKGQGCEMSVTLGADEQVTVSIAGLNEFGDKGYGECEATVTR
jgi:hypothetical protein